VSTKDGLRSLRGVDVAEVGGKPCKQRLDFDSLPIPIDKGRHRETVPLMWNST
jgi:hypothetical protein